MAAGGCLTGTTGTQPVARLVRRHDRRADDELNDVVLVHAWRRQPGQLPYRLPIPS